VVKKIHGCSYFILITLIPEIAFALILLLLLQRASAFDSPSYRFKRQGLFYFYPKFCCGFQWKVPEKWIKRYIKAA